MVGLFMPKYKIFLSLGLILLGFCDCSKAADLISNSWIVSANYSAFPKVSVDFQVDTVDEAGIFPLSSLFFVKCPVKSNLSQSRDPSQLIFCGDISKSMEKGWSSVIDAAEPFMKNIGERDKALVYSFAEWPIYTNIINRKDQNIKEELKALTIGGGTHLYDCLAHVARRIRGDGLQNRFLLLFSDGKDQANVYSATRASKLSLKQSAEELSQAGIKIMPISISAEANQVVMDELALLTGGKSNILAKDKELKNTFRDIKELTGFSNLLTFEDPFVEPGPRTVEITLIYRGDKDTWLIPYNSADMDIPLFGLEKKIGGISWNPEYLTGAGDSRRIYIRGLDEKSQKSTMARANDFALKVEALIKPEIIKIPERIDLALILDSSGSMEPEFERASWIFQYIFANITDEIGLECFNFAARLSKLEIKDKIVEIKGIKPKGITAFYDCLSDGATRVSKRDNRSGILVLSDGWDQTAINSRHPASRNSLEDLTRLCKGLNIPVFTLSIGPRPRKSALSAISRATGGLFFDLSEHSFNNSGTSDISGPSDKMPRSSSGFSWASSTNLSPLQQDITEKIKGELDDIIVAIHKKMFQRRPCLSKATFQWPANDKRDLLLTIISDSPSGKTSCAGQLEPPKNK